MSFFQNLGCLFFVEFINFRPGRDFINVRGLLIQGGDYIYIYIYMYIVSLSLYIYIYIYICCMLPCRAMLCYAMLCDITILAMSCDLI